MRALSLKKRVPAATGRTCSKIRGKVRTREVCSKYSLSQIAARVRSSHGDVGNDSNFDCWNDGCSRNYCQSEARSRKRNDLARKPVRPWNQNVLSQNRKIP